MEVNFTTENPVDFYTTTTTEVDPYVEAQYHIMYKIGEVLNIAYLPIIVPFGIIGNILSFLVMMDKHNRNSSFSLFIAVLAVSDTIVLLCGLTRYLNLVHEVYMPPSQFRHCGIIIAVTLAGILCSTLLIVSMTVGRCYGIIRPHKAVMFNTVKRAKVAIVCIIIFSILFNVPHLFTSTNIGLLCVSFGTGAETTVVKIYYWLTFIIPVFIPFLMLLIMNCIIIHTLRKRMESNILRDLAQGKNPEQPSKMQQSEKQVYTILLLVSFTLLVSHTPVNVMIFYINYVEGNTPYYYAGVHLFYHVAEKAYFTNHAINFILYVLSGQKFRKDFVQLFKRKKNSNSSKRHCVYRSNNIPSVSADVTQPKTDLALDPDYEA